MKNVGFEKYIEIGVLIFFLAIKFLLPLIATFINWIASLDYDSVIYRIVTPKNKRKLNKFYKNCNYFRDVPNKGIFQLTYVLAKDYGLWKIDYKNVVVATILQMILNKNILSESEKDENHYLVLKNVPNDIIFKDLFDILTYASKDKILETEELKEYILGHPEIFENYFYVLKKEGRKILQEMGAYAKQDEGVLEDLTEKGKKELEEVYGLKKFLHEFTLVDIRGIDETIIWEHLLVYAAMFGEAERLYKQIKNIVPINLEMINIIAKYQNAKKSFCNEQKVYRKIGTDLNTFYIKKHKTCINVLFYQY